jgi:hypothetical protein
MTRWVGRSDDLIQCLEIRRAVFIEEQGVSVEDEVDGKILKRCIFCLGTIQCRSGQREF